MKYENFNMKDHGFVGHLAEPDVGADKAVLVVMGGEQSMFPGIMVAERFADYGIAALSVSLFGAEGLPAGPNQIPLEMFEEAVKYLREKKAISHISVYGQSMGSIFAVLIAQYIGGMENLIMISPTHVPFEGTLDKRNMTGRSIATYKGEDVPFVSADFSKVKVTKYQRHQDAKCKVTGMWVAYHDAYQDKTREKDAWLHIEETGARVLMIAGDEDEEWPADYSVKAMKQYLDEVNYSKEVRVVIYHHGSHLNGLMPDKRKHKKIYRMLPLIGIFFRTLGRYKKLNISYFEQTEREVIKWIRSEQKEEVAI